jgi:hypothetical protein
MRVLTHRFNVASACDAEAMRQDLHGCRSWPRHSREMVHKRKRAHPPRLTPKWHLLFLYVELEDWLSLEMLWAKWNIVSFIHSFRFSDYFIAINFCFNAINSCETKT